MASTASPAVEPGFLFMCSNATFAECMRRSLLGESREKLGQVQESVQPSTPLLLLNFSKRVVYGPFWAAVPPELNIEPSAWEGGATNSRRRGKSEPSGAGDATTPYPVQVRIQRRGRVRSWPLPESLHLRAGRLTVAQTDALLQALKPGSVAAEADGVATAPHVGAAAAAAASPTHAPLGAIATHTADLSSAGEGPASATRPRGRGRGRLVRVRVRVRVS